MPTIFCGVNDASTRVFQRQEDAAKDDDVPWSDDDDAFESADELDDEDTIAAEVIRSSHVSLFRNLGSILTVVHVWRPQERSMGKNLKLEQAAELDELEMDNQLYVSFALYRMNQS
jgi:hypothetical protein